MKNNKKEEKKLIKEEIEILEPIHKKIDNYRKLYKVPKRARDINIIHNLLKEDWGIKVPVRLINVNKHKKSAKPHYEKGKFLDLITCLLRKSYFCGRIDAKLHKNLKEDSGQPKVTPKRGSTSSNQIKR